MSGTTSPKLSPDTAATAEDGTLTAAGNLLANDADNNGRTLGIVSVSGVSVSGTTTVVGTYGTLLVQPNGDYTYTLNNTGSSVRALQNGQAAADAFTYVASDGQAYTQTTTVTVQNLIKQSEAFNDASWVGYRSGGAAPVVTANTGAGPNGGASTADAVALSSAGSGLYFQTAVSGVNTFSVWARVVSGSGGFSLGYYGGANGAVSTQAVTATAAWQRFTFTFTGDANSFSNVSLGLAAGQSAGATLQFWGAQLNSGSSAQAYVATTGSPATSTTTQTTPAVLSSTLTVGVTGDRPVASADSGAVTANAQTMSNGNVLSNDTDGAGKTLTVATVNGTAVNGPTTVAGTYGTLVIQPDGTYTYTLGNGAAVQAVANGQVVPDTFNYTVSDGQTYLTSSMATVQNLIPQSEAFNDPSWVPFGTSPAITANADPGPNGGSATADKVALGAANSGLYVKTAASGQLTFSVWVRLISGSGSFSFGYYSGAANNVTSQAATATTAWQRLTFTFTGDGNASSNVSLGHGAGQGSAGTLEFWGAQLNPGASAQTYVPTTGTAATASTTTTGPSVIGSTLSIAVTGASSSSPPQPAPDTASVTEDGGVQKASGNVLGNDAVFGGRTLTVSAVNGTAVNGATVIAGTYGALTIQPNGQYTYTLGNAQANVRALANGQTATDSFSYAVTDGQTSTKTVSQASQNLVSQSEAFASSAWILFSATGLPGSTVTGSTGPGPSGGASTAGQLDLLGPSAGLYYGTGLSGQYTFSIWVRLISGTPAFSFNYFSAAAGKSVLQTASATGDWQRLSFTFNGDGNTGSNVAVMHGPLQSGDTVLELWGAQINAGATAGTYVPTMGTVVNTTTTSTVPISSTLTVSVNGVTPVAVVDTAAVTAGGTTAASGNLLGNDTDANGLPLTLATIGGVAVNGSTSITGAYGTLTVQPNGQYAYSLASGQPAVQALSAGQTAADSFSYTVSDGQVHTAVSSLIAENLITQSEAFDAAAWTRFSPGALPVVTANVDTGPQGGASTADRVALTVPGAGLSYVAPFSGSYTFSVWAKLVSGSGAFTFNYLETTAGANFAQTATAGTGWQRFSFGLTGDGNPNSAIALEVGGDQPGGTFEFWGAQINAGTVADSYGPTAGTGATTVTAVTSPAPATASLAVTVGGSDTGKAGAALNFQSSARGVVANLATGQWSYATTALPLGDSITYGWGVADAQVQSFTSEGYRGPLWSQFLAGSTLLDLVGDKSNGPAALLDPLNAGYPGERTDQIAAHLPGLLATQHPDDILLLAGINDLKEGFSPASVGSNIAGILSTVAAANPSTRAFVALITPTSASTASAATIATANSNIRTAVQNAAANGIKATVVDTGNITINDVLPDGVHLTAGGYGKLAQDYASAITAAQPVVAGTPGGTANTISGTVVSLVGGNGNDLLIGDTRANFITAGAGNDVLIGGGGNDVLTGGTGADEFVFTGVAGQVMVNGFNPGKGDLLDWNIAGVTSAASLSGHVTQANGATVVDLSSFVPNLRVSLAGYTGDLSHSIFGPPAG